MARMARGALVALLAAAALPACAPRTASQSAGLDTEIARDVQWRLRYDRKFENVIAVCVNMKLTLVGRVATPQDAEEARGIALSLGRGAEVISQLEIRQR